MTNFLRSRDEQYFKSAQVVDLICNQLDICLRTVNTRDIVKTRIAITQLFYKLQDEIQPILVDLETNLNINIDELPRSGLYRNFNKVLHIESGKKFNSLDDAKSRADESLGDGYLTLENNTTSKDGKWKRIKDKIDFFNV